MATPQVLLRMTRLGHALRLWMGVRGLCAVLFMSAGSFAHSQDSSAPDKMQSDASIAIEYLEIVTPDVEAACANLSAIHGVVFSAPIPEFGNARIAKLGTDGRLGVRAPLGEEGAPVVRPYLRVDDICQAIDNAEATGATFAMLATEIPDQGKFAIYFLDGVQYGLWER